MGCRKLDISQNYESVLTVVGKSLTTEKLQVEHFWETKKMGVNYYPFGSLMPGRSYNSNSYRYGFNNQENIDEIYSVNGSYVDFDFRGYNSRLGRFISADPLIINEQEYPWYTPYQFAGNKPIQYVDLYGLQEGDAKELKFYGKAKLTSGKIGVKVTLFGVTLEVNYSTEGSVGQGVSAEATLSDNGEQNVQAEHVQTNSETGWSFKLGIYGGSETETTESKTTVSSSKGFEQTKETTKTQEVQILNYSNDGKKQKINATMGVEVNLLIIGGGVEAGVELSAPTTP